MTREDARNPGADELDLLRAEAEALGMPGEVTHEAVGIEPTSAEDMLARVKSRSSTPHDKPDELAAHRPRRKLIIRMAAAAAAVAGVITVSVAPWQEHAATAASPPVLDYEFANASNIAFAPGKPAQNDLLSLAKAAQANTRQLGTGDTQYILSDNWFASLEATQAAQLIPKRRQSWFRPDGSVRVQEQSGTPLSPDGRGLNTQPPKTVQNLMNETYPPSGLKASFVRDLDGPVSQVRKSLMDAGECEVRTPSAARASCLFQQVWGLYTQYVVPPKVAAKLWEVLASERTLRSLGTVKDRAGRNGVGISLLPQDSPQFRKVLIISSKTGELFGSEDILIKNDPELNIKAPAIYSFTALLDSRFTPARGPHATE
ncbi:CU044_5270 family protein [Aeromicrobium sp. 9AM]|uniref:CU044_5270 family protein n=1 Tax=Aeromicrobium sp. 9AM TaxID=2653126 RepID=UPI00135B1F06|nr:CU044_5270 family protein [Aeromicrobium sp. 9AM]